MIRPTSRLIVSRPKEPMLPKTIHWPCLLAGMVVYLAAAPSVVAEEPSNDERARSTTTSPGTAETPLRSPPDVRNQTIKFAGDLKPIDDDRARMLLEAVCPESLEQKDGTWQCARCPDFTSRAGSSGSLRLEQMIEGNFLHKKRPEIFASYRGCEADHAAGGGAIVFRRRKNDWSVHYKHPGLNPQQCLVFEADKHPDRLVCRVRAIADGKIIEHVYDTGGDGNIRQLVHAHDNTGRCPDHKFVSSYLSEWKRGEVDEEGHQTLVIEKIQRWRKLGDDKASVCTLSDAGGPWRRHRKMEFVFRFNGEDLERTEVRTRNIAVEGDTKTASKESDEDGETAAD